MFRHRAGRNASGPILVITMRVFTKTVATGMALGAAPLRANSKLNIGVGTYSYHNLSIDEMIVQLKALRIQEIEMSHGEFMLFSKPVADLFQSAREKLDRAGIHCVSYYTDTIKDRHDVDSAIQFARPLGASNITGDATGGTLAQIDERFTREGITLQWGQSLSPPQC